MKSCIRLLTLLVWGSIFVLPLFAENWPQRRGPRGDGHSPETHLPLTWSEERGVVWRCPLPGWGNSTPVIWGDAIFVTSHVDNRQLVLLRIDRATGQVHWTERLRGEYRASPVLADGRIYFLNMDGLCTVIQASDQFRLLAENPLDDRTLASPAVSNGRIFIRGHDALYCIEG